MKKKVRFQDQPTLNWQYRAAVAKEVNRLAEIPKDLFSSTQDRRWDSSVSPTTPPQARPSSQIKQTSSSSTLSDDLRQVLLGEISASSSSLGASSSVRMDDKSSKSNRKNYGPPLIPLRQESKESLLKAVVGGEKGPSKSSSSPSFPTATTPYNNIYNTKRNHSF